MIHNLRPFVSGVYLEFVKLGQDDFYNHLYSLVTDVYNFTVCYLLH